MGLLKETEDRRWYGPYGPYAGHPRREVRTRIVGPDGRERRDAGGGMLWARFLMQEKYGWTLTDDHEVDHIDGDRTHDHLENLVVMDKAAHKMKTRIQGKTGARIPCSECTSLDVPAYAE